jgi:trehalose 6-phosphate phosphatase
VPGVRLEHKGVSLTVHVRAVDPSSRTEVLQTALDVTRPWFDSAELKALDASNAVELLPNIAWNKGDAVRWIVDDVETHARRPTWCIFFGDDVTDEEAFRAIRNGLTVVVGQRPSLARLRLNSPADVAAVLLGVTNRNGHGKEYGQ